MKLDCAVLAAPTKLQGFGVELEGTHSAGDLGFASSVNYQHRNLFRRSESFTFKVRGAYEALGSSQSSIDGNYWEFGAESGITFPRFVFPFVRNSFKRRLKATTEFKIGYSFQTRPGINGQFCREGGVMSGKTVSTLRRVMYSNWWI